MGDATNLAVPRLISVPDGATAELAVFADKAALVNGAAAFIAEQAGEAIDRRGRFAFALSGGSTPKPVYERLASLRGLDWRRVDVFFGDERCVPPDDGRSNFAMAKAALLDRVDIPSQNVHRIRGEAPPQVAAESYAEELRKTLGDGGRLDLVLLGLGENGHTASLFPGLAALEDEQHAVAAAYVEVAGMWRVTMTFPTINAARRVAVLVSGVGKAGVLHEVLQGRREPFVLPAQSLRPEARPAFWLVDAEAASMLT